MDFCGSPDPASTGFTGTDMRNLLTTLWQRNRTVLIACGAMLALTLFFAAPKDAGQTDIA